MVDRFVLFRELGCVACIVEGELRGESRYQTPADVHHEVNGYRTGRTIPLCPWHHRGVPTYGYNGSASDDTMIAIVGPSLAKHPALFRERYGDFDELHERTEDLLKRLRSGDLQDML